jgi:aminomethyltransferase
MKRTALYEAHKKLNARLIDFGGWEMPVQYTSIVDEHHAVRKGAGIFDISHMGEVMVGGPAAAAFLNHILTNDIRKLVIGQGQYTLMCNEAGGVIDDLYAYRISEELFLLIINASRIEVDVAWLNSQAQKFPDRAGLEVIDSSHNYAAVAVQGPKVREFIDACLTGPSSSGTRVAKATDLKKNEIGRFQHGQASAFAARTGYTGEDGFEIIGLNQTIEDIWNKVLELGKPFGCVAAGLGARDTLRTEVCYPLYGHELDEQTTPIEAGLGFFVALDKGDFIGRQKLVDQKANGVAKKLVAFKMTDKSAPPRPHYPIWTAGADARKIGEAVSGTQSPTLGIGIGMGYVPPDCAAPETPIEIEIRGRRSPAVIVRKPLYKKA